MKRERFLYDARVHDDPDAVYDGDTPYLDTDLGKGIWELAEPHRLLGINAPEMRGEQKALGRKSRDWLRQRLAGERFTIETIKSRRKFLTRDGKGKWGRWLVVIWIDGVNVNKEMIELGLAREHFYGSKKPAWW